MTAERMSADKSHLLAYLKHTPGFEDHIHTFRGLTLNEILAHMKLDDPAAHQTCIARFGQRGVRFEIPA